MSHGCIPEGERIKLQTKPPKMQDGAVFRFERVRTVARLALGSLTWDKRTLRCRIEVSPNATLTEIVREAQKRIDEPLEDSNLYSLYHNGYLAMPPWNQPYCELRPEMELAASVVVKNRGGEMTVSVPILHEEW
jgi:acyl carrier protein phosphodiesterase